MAKRGRPKRIFIGEINMGINMVADENSPNLTNLTNLVSIPIVQSKSLGVRPSDILKFRSNNGLNQKELANLMGVHMGGLTITSVCRYENGNKMPQNAQEAFLKVCGDFKTSPKILQKSS